MKRVLRNYLANFSLRSPLVTIVTLSLAAPVFAQQGNSPWENTVNVLMTAFASTILGAERKLFFFAMCLGAATFNLLGTLLGGLLMFLLLYFVARWATQTDPQILRFLLSAARLRSEYDPMKFAPIVVRKERDA